MVILEAMSQSGVAQKVIFYGGTALRLAYHGMRFSEDLDFLMTQKISTKELNDVLLSVCTRYPLLTLVEVIDKKNTLFGLIKFTYPSLKHPRHIKIEISKKEGDIESELRALHSPCSPFSPLLQTITLESLEHAKIAAIKGRKEPRDWLDLWLIANQLRKPFTPPIPFPYQEKYFRRELKRFLPKNKWIIIDEIIT